MSKRAEWIKAHYSLKQADEGWWEAISLNADGTIRTKLSGSSRDAACRLARVWWGHFNLADEAEAFNEIFS